MNKQTDLTLKRKRGRPRKYQGTRKERMSQSRKKWIAKPENKAKQSAWDMDSYYSRLVDKLAKEVSK